MNWYLLKNLAFLGTLLFGSAFFLYLGTHHGADYQIYVSLKSMVSK